MTHAKMLASVELARGALAAARCRLAEEESVPALGRELAVTVEDDFRGVAGRARGGGRADAGWDGGRSERMRRVRAAGVVAR